MKDSIAPQRLSVLFDDDSLVANAGILPAAILLQRLSIRELFHARLSLGSAAANPNRSDKPLTLICSTLTGGGCIDDVDVLCAVDTARILGFKVKRRPPFARSCAHSGGTTCASWTRSAGLPSSAPERWEMIRATNRL